MIINLKRRMWTVIVYITWYNFKIINYAGDFTFRMQQIINNHPAIALVQKLMEVGLKK